MATVLDLGLFQFFSSLYPVIFTFAVVFAILAKYKFPTDSLAINGIIAVMVSFMVLLSQTLIDLINFMIPWFTLAIIFLVLLLLLFRIMGADDESIANQLSKPAVHFTILGIGLVIILAGLGITFGQNVGPYLNQENATVTSNVATGDLSTNLVATLFHPKVLGLMLIFAIAIFAVIFLTMDGAPEK